MPSQSQDALSMLLMQNLMKQSGGMTPGADPFAPEPGGEAAAAPGRRDPFSQPQATTGSAAQRLAEGMGVDVGDLEQPVSGPMAEALGVEGVEPDFDQAEKLIKLMQLSKQMGMQEALGQQGGPPPADPITRNALTYQAIQNSVQRFGPGHAGGQILNSLSPLLAPYMMGPALERQRAETAQAERAKQMMELEKTRQLGEKRRADTDLAIARRKKLEQETILLGKKEYELKGTPSTGMAIFDPDTGNIIHVVEPTPKGREQAPPKPFTAIDPTDGNTYRYEYRNYEDMWNRVNGKRDLVKPSGSAEERRSLAESYTLAEKLIPEIQAIHERTKGRLVGPQIGRWLEDRKTGGEGILGKRVGQMTGKAMTNLLLSEGDLKDALDLKFKVETLNQALNRLYTGLAYNDTEYQQRKNSMGLMTDYPLDFGKAITQQQQYLIEARKRREKLLGIEPGAALTVDDILNQRTASTSPSTGFSGAPTTKVPGELQRDLDKQMADELSRDLGF